MVRIVNKAQQLTAGVVRPTSGYSRVFGLACKAAVGVGAGDFAYSPPMGRSVWLRFMSIWYGGSDSANNCAGTIYVSSGTGVPTALIISTQWEIVVPFWAGTTKPAIMVQGREGYLSWPMSRPYTGESRRFGLRIENGSASRPFWVNVWFEIAEG